MHEGLFCRTFAALHLLVSSPCGWHPSVKARGRVTLVQEIAQEQGVQAQPTVQAWKMGKCIEVRRPRNLCCSVSSETSQPCQVGSC